jgi:hypothetical protein
MIITHCPRDGAKLVRTYPEDNGRDFYYWHCSTCPDYKGKVSSYHINMKEITYLISADGKTLEDYIIHSGEWEINPHIEDKCMDIGSRSKNQFFRLPWSVDDLFEKTEEEIAEWLKTILIFR